MAGIIRQDIPALLVRQSQSPRLRVVQVYRLAALFDQYQRCLLVVVAAVPAGGGQRIRIGIRLGFRAAWIIHVDLPRHRAIPIAAQLTCWLTLGSTAIRS